MAEISWAQAHEREEIIEFIDYVFSKAHRPHDFASLLPKLYGGHGDGAAHHFVVRENGKIAATVLCYPVVMHVGGRKLLMLGVGSVSTHPNARGKGYMKLIMDAVDARAQALGADFAVLSGQRQRYQYFGYDHGGYQLNGRLAPANVRHALRELSTADYAVVPMTQAHVPQAMALLAAQPCFCERSEPAYLDILRSWNNEPFALLRCGEPVGFGALRHNEKDVQVAELLLENEEDFAQAMKLLSQAHGTVSLCAAPWQTQRAKWLSAVCEEFDVSPNNMFKIYKPERVSAACGKLHGFLDLCLPLYVAPPDCV